MRCFIRVLVIFVIFLFLVIINIRLCPYQKGDRSIELTNDEFPLASSSTIVYKCADQNSLVSKIVSVFFTTSNKDPDRSTSALNSMIPPPSSTTTLLFRLAPLKPLNKYFLFSLLILMIFSTTIAIRLVKQYKRPYSRFLQEQILKSFILYPYYFIPLSLTLLLLLKQYYYNSRKNKAPIHPNTFIPIISVFLVVVLPFFVSIILYYYNFPSIFNRPASQSGVVNWNSPNITVARSNLYYSSRLGIGASVGLSLALNMDYCKSDIKTRDSISNGIASWIFVISIIAIYIFIYLKWNSPGWGEFMTRYFTYSPMKNTPISIITVAFSHRNFYHLIFNVTLLLIFGIPIANRIGIKSLLWLILTTGVFSCCITHIWIIWLSMNIDSEVLSCQGIGASGAMFGLLGFTFYSLPETRIRIPWLPEIFIPTYIFIGLWIAFETIGLIFGSVFRAGSIVHSSGFFFGFGYAIWREKTNTCKKKFN